MVRNAARLALVVTVVVVAACAAELGDPADNTELVSADDTAVGSADISSSYPVGSILRTTANLNLRTGASTSYRVILVMAQGSRVTLTESRPRSGWYHVRYGSTTGWAYGGYLALVSTPSSTTGRDRAISRAQSGVGFSYWWGHGRWLSGGPSSSTRGSCSGSCPSCSHSGGYGADCSGFVAKAWWVPSTNTDLSHDYHPYSTYNFYNERTHWAPISRSSIRKADALVYRSGSSGHIVLYQSSSDPWGNLWVYEARGCSYGIVHNLRTVLL